VTRNITALAFLLSLVIAAIRISTGLLGSFSIALTIISLGLNGLAIVYLISGEAHDWFDQKDSDQSA
jgi:hypothetical protein